MILVDPTDMVKNDSSRNKITPKEEASHSAGLDGIGTPSYLVFSSSYGSRLILKVLGLCKDMQSHLHDAKQERQYCKDVIYDRSDGEDSTERIPKEHEGVKENHQGFPAMTPNKLLASRPLLG
jgi:hypothetical protein